jgi:hypothetical protein
LHHIERTFGRLNVGFGGSVLAGRIIKRIFQWKKYTNNPKWYTKKRTFGISLYFRALDWQSNTCRGASI